MRLHRLKLENWRGVTSREIEFGEGVTIIEGPNEIGKTSLVEAFKTLISELDSSAKQAIKAIQPVDRDVGSTVEADIQTGDYRFTYRKTFNKSKETTLTVTAPAKEQLTGRDAHDRVEKILADTVDLALWEALLVNQGKEITAVDIQNSAALSKALDEAAGTGSSGDEDTDLFAAIQAEYESYFTLKAGKQKFTAQESTVETAKTHLAEAQERLKNIEADTEKLERLQADLKSRAKDLPEQSKAAASYDDQWRKLHELKTDLALKEKDLAAARVATEQAEKAVNERHAQVALIERLAEQIKSSAAKIEPERANIEALKASVADAKHSRDALKSQAKSKRSELKLVEADIRYLRQLEELERCNVALEDLAKLGAAISQSADIVAAIRADDEGLKAVQKAENDLRILEGRRDTAATRILVAAERDQDITIGPAQVSISAGATESQLLSRKTTLTFPGIASITIEPPDSTADLSSEADELKATLDSLLAQYGAESREQMAALLERKRLAQADLEKAKVRTNELLGSRTKTEVERQSEQLAKTTQDYLQARDEDVPLPTTTAEGETHCDTIGEEIEGIEARVAEADRRLDQELAQQTQAESEIRDEEVRLDSSRAQLKDAEEKLALERERQTDDSLGSAHDAAIAALKKAEETVDNTKQELESLDPERLKSLRDNAKAVLERAEKELRDLKQEVAVLQDRLEQSQASGRFEELERAERELDEAEVRYTATRRRADAAQLLWQKINQHRDAARQMYVKPLKDAIEKLGRIVFGADFDVSIGEDWAIETRTLGGKTIPFSELSIGAKEQLGILTRLAAAQIVSQQGGVPLIIDDALGFSDPDRLETMGAAFSAAGRDSQVIILTCSPGRFKTVGSAQLIHY